MIRRTIAAVSFLFLVGSGCSSWKSIEDRDSGALSGQAKLILLPLGFDTAQIDGDPEKKWIAGQDEEQRAAWPSEKDYIWKAFQKSVIENLDGRVLLTSAENPDGATLTLKPFVVELESPGWGKTKLTVGVQVLDAKGTLLEEISTKVKAGDGPEFKVRVANAAEKAGDNLASYVRKRTGK